MDSIREEPIDPVLTCQGTGLGKMLPRTFLIAEVAENRVGSTSDILEMAACSRNSESPDRVGSSAVRFLDSLPAQMVACSLSKRLIPSDLHGYFVRRIDRC
jgi:hypothetical protein